MTLTAVQSQPYLVGYQHIIYSTDDYLLRFSKNSGSNPIFSLLISTAKIGK